MKSVPTVTQSNVHIFIPHKAAYVVTRLQRDEKLTTKDSLLRFYNSRTYRQLERESTKRWQDNVKQLYADFLREAER